jgi:hypothetical protein
VIIAIDSWGDEDREVNGVLFQEDKSNGGTVEKDGVEVTTNQANMIDGWAGAPLFSGGQGDSAENLALVMQDIRWNGAPNPVTIEMKGLPPNTLVEVQLLTNEGADRNRRWDIGAGDIDEPELIVDDYTSEGISADSDVGDEGVWTEENSFVATFEVKTSDTGELTVVMRQHIGGQDPPGGDNNPILQAVIVHRAVPEGEPALIIEEGVAGNQAFEGALGMDFVVNLPIQVVQLGAFDSESDELARPITVELWSRDDGGTPDDFGDDAGGEILASLEFEGEAGTLEGGTRFSPLDAPVVLLPGAYTIVGWGYGPDEQNYNVGGRDAAAEGLTITESKFITFLGGSRFGDPGVNGEWPTSPDGGPENRYGSGNFKFASTGDTDADGMPDPWEELHGLNPADPADAGQDADGDTLTNLQEFEKGTDPNSDDTDEDGSKDNVETNTGTWVSATDTGTNPNKEDSDGDGLKDGVETNTKNFVSATDTGTDPNLKDSDGDRASDGAEVATGTDPTVFDENRAPVLVAHYEFEDPDDLGLDSSGNENHAEVVEEVEQVDGPDEFGKGGFFDESLASNFHIGPLDGGFTGKPGVTLAAWVKLDEASTGFDGIISQDAGGCCQNRILLHPDHAVFINLSEHADRHLSSGPLLEFDVWTHVAMTGLDLDGEAEARVYVNGEEIEGSPQIFPEMDDGSDWNTYLGVGESGTAHRLTGALDDARVYQGALTADEIPVLMEPLTPPTTFQITNITRSPTEISLRWSSRTGKEYSVEYNDDLSNDLWIELDDGVQSEGEETSFTDDDAERAGKPEGWYRIRDNG